MKEKLFALIIFCFCLEQIVALQCDNVKIDERIDCNPDNPSKEKCSARGCCWRSANHITTGGIEEAPECYYPKDYIGYKVKNITRLNGVTRIILGKQTPSGFPHDISTVFVDVHPINDKLIRIKIYDGNTSRYEVPIPKLNYNQINSTNQLYTISYSNDGNLTVIRNSTGKIVFETNFKYLTFADQYLQLTTSLSSKFVYGLGEHKDYFRKEAKWNKYILYNTDAAPSHSGTTGSQLYGTQPFHMSVEDKLGNSNGMLMFNSNPMEVTLQPKPSLTWRTIGGVFDVFIMFGPSPNDVIRQYSNLVGLPNLPPFWSLGFHLCRYGYGTLENTEKTFQRNIKAGIPIEVQWNDIDFMDKHNNFIPNSKTFANLSQFIDKLHQQGRRYIPMVDVGIGISKTPGSYLPYDDGLKYDIFIKNSSEGILFAKVWNDDGTVFPDFTHPNATRYWAEQFAKFHKIVPFDGVWNDMNEPSNFVDGSIHGCPDSKYENPQYAIAGGPLRTRTVCMTAKHHIGMHYNLHNIYGLTEVIASNQALKALNKRPFIISRSNFVGLGYYGGIWDGDITSNWETLGWTISSILNYNLFAIPMSGADICGFASNTTVELCARWQALGAFYPFSRNHNEDQAIEQDPAALGPEVVAATKNSLEIRYSLLPFLYTLFYKAHVHGDTVFRPLFFEFPTDQNSYTIDQQFLWGDALMFIPTLNQGASNVTGYIPPGKWYHYNNYSVINSKGVYATYDSPLTSPPVILIRGGRIIPVQEPKMTTTETREGNFSLIIALSEINLAYGHLYWDDGESIDVKSNYNLLKFLATKDYFSVDRVFVGYKVSMILDKMSVLGVNQRPNQVSVNGKSIPFSHDNSTQILYVKQINASLLDKLEIKWS